MKYIIIDDGKYNLQMLYKKYGTTDVLTLIEKVREKQALDLAKKEAAYNKFIEELDARYYLAQALGLPIDNRNLMEI